MEDDKGKKKLEKQEKEDKKWDDDFFEAYSFSQEEEALKIQQAIFLSLQQESDQHETPLRQQQEEDEDLVLQQAISLSLQVQEQQLDSHQEITPPHNQDDDVKQSGSICICYSFGESSRSECGICGYYKSSGSMKRISRHCAHWFCGDCIRVYVWKRVQKNVRCMMICPHNHCDAPVDFNLCGEFLPKHVLERWANQVREGVAIAKPEFLKCPYIECNAWILDDGKSYMIRACQECWRIFCVKCRACYKWHMGKTCKEVLDEDLARLDRLKHR
ncbi:hypothetical protein ACH5RR_024287 [Cinchona calisaya]|uniref:RBR-type E3 ubiquitin transferase n=1 Tax=Cinchona calisaya TaxID=153742 RepID=A0ABD2YZS6_9GENT